MSTQRTINKVAGPEAHLSGVFHFTMHKINNLGTEVDRLRAINENLAQKLEGTAGQKEALMAKNLDVEHEILGVRAENEELILKRDAVQRELQQLKQVLGSVDYDWDQRKKELQLEIANLKHTKKSIAEEKARERLCYAHQKARLARDIKVVTGGISQNAPEIKKNEDRIMSFERKENNSVKNMASEITRFRQFLDNVKRY